MRSRFPTLNSGSGSLAQTSGVNQKPFPAFWGIMLCWIAVLIYAASNSVVTLLVEIGDSNRVKGHNVVTFANLLVLGSLISLVPMLFFFGRDWTAKNLRSLTSKDWLILVVSTMLSSAVTPGLFFFALENTTVTNVVIAGRIDPPLFLVLAAIILKEKLDPWAFAGGLIILIGAVAILVLDGDAAGFKIGSGEIAAVVATLSFTVSTIITRASLKHVPLGIFSIFRTVLGTIVYVSFNLFFSSHHHFGDMFQPVLLKWIWVYAILVIIIGQFSWNLGLKHASASDVALATSFSPLAAISIAIFLLGEDPGDGLLLGAAIMFIGIAVARFGNWRKAGVQKVAIEKAIELESKVNFKGV